MIDVNLKEVLNSKANAKLQRLANAEWESLQTSIPEKLHEAAEMGYMYLEVVVLYRPNVDKIYAQYEAANFRVHMKSTGDTTTVFIRFGDNDFPINKQLYA